MITRDWWCLFRTVTCALSAWRSMSCHCTPDQGSHGC